VILYTNQDDLGLEPMHAISLFTRIAEHPGLARWDTHAADIDGAIQEVYNGLARDRLKHGAVLALVHNLPVPVVNTLVE
jgi:hypothetical protein